MSTLGQYSEIQAYKHLLQVAQNIIYSTESDQSIIKKYQQLKKSVLRKIPSTSYQPSNQHYHNMLSIYRNVIDNTIKIIQKFQEELQNEMERKNYNELIIDLNKGVENKINQIEGLMNNQHGFSSSTSSMNTNKMKLLYKEEINTLKYQFDQLDAKFENLGLLIEVHKKMHQIILEATKTEQKRTSIDQNYKERIKELQSQIQQINDVNSFINQHRITQQKYKEFKIASKKLGKILFQK